ncbi:hypothetical protein H7J87_15425 [Mycolicibacterium wolinskyi]|uniref:Uncharacterized protein n=1 Tax=Mycolicibacterium wolinskyi TaxID=59750 RepID=A0A1X2F857_9MYCO|nr:MULTISPECIES: hypothetical protein [Mycolicibacterium]MCV7286718.1 hypothetical protein [Mycolicibacterium wolinskyi]MCV7293698.1 hypothetical protein [Mycolicibacterium goodii]ORX14584.1 hypothetical protein AWC31_25715 [Mycolicibacterium wolinskyi]
MDQHTTAETWTTRDLPVLRAIVDLYEETGDPVSARDIEHRTGFDEDSVQRALRRLNTRPSLLDDVTDTAQGIIVDVGAPTRAALQVSGAWPSPENLLDRLVGALHDAADDADRPDDQRSKLKQLALGFKSIGYQVAIGALGGAGGNLLSG